LVLKRILDVIILYLFFSGVWSICNKVQYNRGYIAKTVYVQKVVFEILTFENFGFFPASIEK